MHILFPVFLQLFLHTYICRGSSCDGCFLCRGLAAILPDMRLEFVPGQPMTSLGSASGCTNCGSISSSLAQVARFRGDCAAHLRPVVPDFLRLFPLSEFFAPSSGVYLLSGVRQDSTQQRRGMVKVEYWLQFLYFLNDLILQSFTRSVLHSVPTTDRILEYFLSFVQHLNFPTCVLTSSFQIDQAFPVRIPSGPAGST